MQKIIVIVTKTGIKHQFGIDKNVSDIINEINACKDDFYFVIDACALKVDEIVSVEQFEVEVEGETE